MSCCAQASCSHAEKGWQDETLVERALQLTSDCLLLAEKDNDERRARARQLIRHEHELATGSAEEWDRRAQRALQAIGRAGSRKPAQARAFLRIIARRFEGLDESLRPLYEEKIRLCYGLGRDGVAADLEQSVTFNTVDQQARSWLVEHNLFWVGQAYDNEFSGRIARIVDEQVVQQGLSYRDAATVLQEQLGPQLTGSRPLAYWEVVANAAAVRSRSFGAVESFVQGGITVVEILNPEDEATCPTCSHLSGQRFEIRHVVEQRNAMLAAATPEEAKAIAPWRPPGDVVGKGPEELAGQGTVLPPFHGRCRCTANAWVEGMDEGTTKPGAVSGAEPASAPAIVTGGGRGTGGGGSAAAYTPRYVSPADAQAWVKANGVTIDVGDNHFLHGPIIDSMEALKAKGMPLPKGVKVGQQRYFKSRFGKEYRTVAAAFDPRTQEMVINLESGHWYAGGKVISNFVRKGYNEGEISSDNPLHVFFHEYGHNVHFSTTKGDNSAKRIEEYEKRDRARHGVAERQLALKVSRRAGTTRGEFIAEMFAALMNGRTFPDDVMEYYRTFGGLVP